MDKVSLWFPVTIQNGVRLFEEPIVQHNTMKESDSGVIEKCLWASLASIQLGADSTWELLA